MEIKRESSIGLWLAWNCIAAVSIVAIASQLRFGKALPASTPQELVFIAQLVAAHIGAAMLLAWRTRNGRTVTLTEVALIAAAFFGGCSLLLLVKQAFYSPFLLLSVTALSGFSILLSLFFRRRVLLPMAVVIAVVAASLQPLKERPKELLDVVLGNVPKPQRTQAIINTSLYVIKATFYDHYFDVCDPRTGRCDGPRNGGGLRRFAGGHLLATGEGLLHFFTIDASSGALNAKPLPYAIPINSADFLKQGPKAELRVFRVMDTLVREEGGRFELLASHHYWKLDQQCSVIRISRLEGNVDEFLAGTMRGEWKTVFETRPCLPLKYGPHGRPFAGDESGGRMALLDERTLLLTVGDQQFDGWNSAEHLSQDDAKDYGKTITIDLSTGKSAHFTKGHRNPQGLYVAPDRTLWATEHGPEGGDELNVLVQGANYGWPLATYGTEYGLKNWPLNPNRGEHTGYQRPFYAWVPSIAVSSLVGAASPLFPLWNGDLLVCSYSESLQRVRIREGRVAFVEPILVRKRNGRLRHIDYDRDGRILLWLDTGTLAVLEPAGTGKVMAGQAEQGGDGGKLLFTACAACHKVGDGTAHGIGPDLAGIVGRAVASASGFAYSDAMKKESGYWSEERLQAYLENPQKAVPGTSMQFPGLADPGERARLTAYLKTLRQP